MITLKEYILKNNKKDSYEVFKRICDKDISYDKITRLDIYKYLLDYFTNMPEKILEMCSNEEINMLKLLLSENIQKKENGYLEYVLLENLKSNYLILESETEVYIPNDFLNCIKMALNLIDEKEHAYQDVNDSVVLGLIRIYNVLEFSEFEKLFKKYVSSFEYTNLREYIKINLRLNKMIKLVVYKKKEYVISLENEEYKDVLEFRCYYKIHKDYLLEEVISVGKYKINLFDENILYFLNFLELHTSPKYINNIINGAIVYSGFDIDDDKILRGIANNIEELYLELKKVVHYLPCWIYNGNDVNYLEKTLVNVDVGAKCPCGSGRKYKMCCGK